MVIFYKIYEHSMLATLVNVLSRLCTVFALIGIFACMSESLIVLAVLCAILMVVCLIGGTKWSDAIAKKADMKYYERKNQKYVNLVPCYQAVVEENGQMVQKLVPDYQNRPLQYPVMVSICRDNAFAGKAASIEYMLNGNERCKLKCNQGVNFYTSQRVNTVTVKNAPPVTFVVEEGESVVLHFKVLEFNGMERVHR